MIADVPKDTLLPIIQREVVRIRSSIPTLIPLWVLDVSEFDHHRIDHSDAYVLDRHNNINGIENFWNQAKGTLSRYNGIPKAHFPLFLKEAESLQLRNTPPLKRWAKLKALPTPSGTTPSPFGRSLEQPEHIGVRSGSKRFPANAVKGWQSANPLQIIQKRLRTTTFGLQIFLDSIF
jgi:hypothetical protein